MDETMYREALTALQVLMDLIPVADKPKSIYPSYRIEVALKSMWRALLIAQSDDQAENPK